MHSDETDRINSLAKLAMHRIVARVMARDHGLVERANQALLLMEQRIGHAAYMDEWRVVLHLPETEVRRLITSRSETMDRLRISSPFMTMWKDGLDFSDPDFRRRIWRLAKRVSTFQSRRDETWSPGANRAA